MPATLSSLLLHWTVTALSLWVASRVFRGLRFADLPALLVSALLLGVANAVVRPLLIVVTLPITILTLGLFLLVINALMLQLVAALVRGFTISGFWTALLAGALIALLSFAAESWLSETPLPLTAPAATPSRGRLIETERRPIAPAAAAQALADGRRQAATTIA